MFKQRTEVKITEHDFSIQVESLLTIFGWRWIHFRPAWSSKGYRTPIKGDKGFPDYCCVRPPRLIFAELKDKYSKPNPEQEAWLEDLKECMKKFEVYLWKPDDIDEIIAILR